MDINLWTDNELDYCVSLLPNWRKINFQEQENLIMQMLESNKLLHSPEEIRLRFNYLDKLTNNEFSTYQLLTIPASDKRFIGICKKE